MQGALTSMMQQYRRLGSSIPADTLLLFRLGDFYELLFEDAREAAGLLKRRADQTYHRSNAWRFMPRGAELYREADQGGRRVAICRAVNQAEAGFRCLPARSETTDPAHHLVEHSKFSSCAIFLQW